MKAQLKSTRIMLPIILVILCISMPLAAADTTKTINIASNIQFANTGYELKSYIVDVSAIKNAKQIVIHITGQGSSDPYLRYLLVKVDGQIINARTLGGDKPWSSYTALVKDQFDLRYDVTNLVKGKDSVTVEIGLSTFTGSWTVSAEFQAVLEESTTIPMPGTEQESYTIKNSWLAAAGGAILIATAYYIRQKELE